MTVSNITILMIISMLFYSCSALTILFYVLDRTDNFYKKIEPTIKRYKKFKEENPYNRPAPFKIFIDEIESEFDKFNA